MIEDGQHDDHCRMIVRGWPCRIRMCSPYEIVLEAEGEAVRPFVVDRRAINERAYAIAAVQLIITYWSDRR